MTLLRSIFVFALTALATIAQTPAPAPDLARNPALAAIPINPALPTIFIAGDSTAARGRGATQQGWAVPFADYFDLTKVNIVNRAREIIARRYDELGPEKVNPFFADEHTHTSAAGAEFNAACVVTGLKELPKNPVAPYLRPGA